VFGCLGHSGTYFTSLLLRAVALSCSVEHKMTCLSVAHYAYSFLYTHKPFWIPRTVGVGVGLCSVFLGGPSSVFCFKFIFNFILFYFIFFPLPSAHCYLPLPLPLQTSIFRFLAFKFSFVSMVQYFQRISTIRLSPSTFSSVHCVYSLSKTYFLLLYTFVFPRRY